MSELLSPVCVTGACGYVGSHVVRELLERGYEVRGTTRDPAAARASARAPSGIELHRADLTAPGSFEDAVKGCRAVIHAASPLRPRRGESSSDLIDAAVRGTRNVLDAAANAGTVERVVQTSSISAIAGGFSSVERVRTEDDWNESATVASSAYAVSKRDAERAAVAFRESLPESGRFELTAIHPGFVLGPVHAEAHLESSPALIHALLDRWRPSAERYVAVVDARDVAAAHARALEVRAPAARYVVVAESLSVQQIARILKRHHPDRAISARRLPPALVRLAGSHGRRRSRMVRFSSERACEQLGLSLRPAEESIAACARSIVDAGWVSAGRGPLSFLRRLAAS